MPAAPSRRAFENCREIGAAQRLRESSVLAGRQFLDRETLATLRAARTNDSLPAFAAHAHQKAVGTFTPDH